MFSKWINNLAQSANDTNERTEKDLHSASALLLLEVARADYEIDEAERDEIVQAIRQTSALSATELDQLVAEAEQQAASAISYHEHIRLINEQFSREQKINLIEQLWRVAYADQELDRYEEAFIRKIADLIYVKHRDFIQAKLRVMPDRAD